MCPYAVSKHLAETEALRVAARGLDVVIVCPAHVFGPGDLGPTSTGVVRRFLLRRIPAYVNGAINVVDVADVAAGHLLADERGVPGERYILGTRNYTWDRLFAELARISGVERPLLEVPRDVALAAVAVAARGPLKPPVTEEEIRGASHWWTCRAARARRELGWTTRPHEDTVEETVRWWEERLGDRYRRAPRSQPLRLEAARGRARRRRPAEALTGRAAILPRDGSRPVGHGPAQGLRAGAGAARRRPRGRRPASSSDCSGPTAPGSRRS